MAEATFERPPNAQLTANQPAPEDYYQSRCRVLFAGVLTYYGDVLDDSTDAFCRAFLRADNEAQRLFARILTRRGPIIRADSLNYREITHGSAAVDKLASLGLILVNPAVAADVLLQRLKKPELLALCCQTRQSARRRYKKDELITGLLSDYSDHQIRERIARATDWIAIANSEVWRRLRLLYFGNEHHDLSTFVLQDLGQRQYEPVSLNVRQFETAAALRDHVALSHYCDLTHRLQSFPQLADELLEALQTPSSHRMSERRRRRALLRLAGFLERQGSYDKALLAYATITEHPARERQVRLLTKLGRGSDSHSLLDDIATNPWCEAERQFATRFGRRNAGYQPPTDVLCVSRVEDSVEQQVLAELLEEHGGYGAHVENTLVRSLTGLLYWEALFTPIPGAFTHPFQSGPHDLSESDFVPVRKPVIDAIEIATAQDADLHQHLKRVALHKQGVSNALVHWTLFDVLPLEQLLEAIPANHIRRLTAFLIRHLGEYRSGLPDLFLAYESGQYELVEVKGPNDQLQPGQRLWLRHLQEMEIPARVVKVRVDA